MKKGKAFDRRSAKLPVIVSPMIHGWLKDLVSFGVYGDSVEAVAEHFVCDGVRRELIGDGLLCRSKSEIVLPQPKIKKGKGK